MASAETVRQISRTVSAEAKYDRQSRKEVKTGGLVDTMCWYFILNLVFQAPHTVLRTKLSKDCLVRSPYFKLPCKSIKYCRISLLRPLNIIKWLLPCNFIFCNKTTPLIGPVFGSPEGDLNKEIVLYLNVE